MTKRFYASLIAIMALVFGALSGVAPAHADVIVGGGTGGAGGGGGGGGGSLAAASSGTVRAKRAPSGSVTSVSNGVAPVA